MEDFDDEDKRFNEGQQFDAPQATVLAAQPGHDAAAFLAAIVESSDDAIISKSLEGIITTWNNGAQRLFGYTSEEIVGQPVTFLIPDDRLDEEPAILARIHAGERVDHFETIRRRKDGTLFDISLTISPIRDGAGNIIGASKIARDISDRKRLAEHRELLLQEMRHRIKNVFAITGSIITLAARTASNPASLAGEMKDRLIALSRAHELTLTDYGNDMLAESSTTLSQLMSTILAPYDVGGDRRWHLSGDFIEIDAGRITSLALLFHELATNSAKYGSLSVENGRLTVTTAKDSSNVEITWDESGGPYRGADEVNLPGFGSRLEAMMVRALNAEISRDWQSGGVIIRLRFPSAGLGDS